MKKQVIFLFGAIALFILFYFMFQSSADTLNLKENNTEGILTLTFDDGSEFQYKTAFTAMKVYNYTGTLFLIANWTDVFESRNLMTFEEAREMQTVGWEIGSHGLSHRNLVGLSYEELQEELRNSKEILESEGFDVRSFAFPYGDSDENSVRVAKEYYSALRPLRSGFNSLENPNFYGLKSKWVMKKYSSKEICTWIKKAKSESLWLILDFHDIREENSPWDFSEQKFKEVLECIDDEGIKVKTIKEVLENEERN